MGQYLPVSHGHLFKHSRASVGLPVARYRCSPKVCRAHQLQSFPFCSRSLKTFEVPKVYFDIHVDFVVIPYLLDSDVILGVNERLCGGVGLGKSHNAGYVLKLTVVVHLYLRTKTDV